MSNETRPLWCDLTDDEVAERSSDLVERMAELGELEAERQKVAQRFKRDLGTLDAEIHELARQVRERREIRDVECRSEVNADGMRLTFRTDTGEVIESRPASAAERQMGLPYRDPPSKPPEPPADVAGYLPAQE